MTASGVFKRNGAREMVGRNQTTGVWSAMTRNSDFSMIGRKLLEGFERGSDMRWLMF